MGPCHTQNLTPAANDAMQTGNIGLVILCLIIQVLAMIWWVTAQRWHPAPASLPCTPLPMCHVSMPRGMMPASACLLSATGVKRLGILLTNGNGCSCQLPAQQAQVACVSADLELASISSMVLTDGPASVVQVLPDLDPWWHGLPQEDDWHVISQQQNGKMMPWRVTLLGRSRELGRSICL